MNNLPIVVLVEYFSTKIEAMSKKQMFTFLRDLGKNNSKEWMDANRSRYQSAKAIWLDEIQEILNRLAQHDPAFEFIEPKKTITRINNNRRFQPDKPIYKDYFTCTPQGGLGIASFHISVGPHNSFIGGGLYRPEKEELTKIRSAIDYNGGAFKELLKEPGFDQFFGGLSPDEQQLKTAPKGYPKDHPHIDLLRRKNFVGMAQLTEKQVVAESFIDLVEEAYLSIRPILAYLQEALAFEEA